MAWEEYSRSKWETIANNMPKYGCPEKWPKELVQKKWHEMHPPDDTTPLSDYEVKWGAGQKDWSDGGDSRSHSLHESDGIAQISTAATTTSTIELSRSRTASDTPSPLHFPQSQSQMMFENHQQHGVWGSGT
jgi:hypothetical protein